MIAVGVVDREMIYEELQRVRVTFRRLVEQASPGDRFDCLPRRRVTQLPAKRLNARLPEPAVAPGSTVPAALFAALAQDH